MTVWAEGSRRSKGLEQTGQDTVREWEVWGVGLGFFSSMGSFQMSPFRRMICLRESTVFVCGSGAGSMVAVLASFRSRDEDILSDDVFMTTMRRPRGPRRKPHRKSPDRDL